MSEVVMDPIEVVETIEEPKAKPQPVVKFPIGHVANCAKLNIRKAPDKNSMVITVVDAGAELTINPNGSTEEWYKVRTIDGAKGFCMKDYVAVEQ